MKRHTLNNIHDKYDNGGLKKVCYNHLSMLFHNFNSYPMFYARNDSLTHIVHNLFHRTVMCLMELVN